MYWYFVYDRLNNASQLIDFFNQQDKTIAFTPKIEKWYGTKRVRDYVIKDLYPHYILI